VATSPYWSALRIINQIAGELGLSQYTTVVATDNVQSTQLLALLNSSGNELMLYYPWEQFKGELTFNTVDSQGSYDLPDDYNYFTDQTQWDRTNHWPLLGPKSAQEWAWLKGGLIASAPRTRFRVYDNKFWIWPVPAVGHSPLNLSMEYISKNWILGGASQDTPADMIALDTDLLKYNPWLLVKYTKMKFYELKGFDTTATQSDFLRVFNSLTGKDVGAPILSLARVNTTQLVGPWSVPDGSWNVFGGP